MAEMNQFSPRLCHIKKRIDYLGYGYGFSLRVDEQDGRQHCWRICIGSPAEEAGLLEGDILIEVNDTNVEEEAHASVVQRITDSRNGVYLLVVDPETDRFYKDQGKTVTAAMPGVKHMDSRTNIHKINPNGPYGQQLMNPYHAGYHQGPMNRPQQLNPYHVGYDQPNYGQSLGGPAGSYPMIQQPHTPTVIQPNVVESDIPSDLTIPAILICFCFCWCVGPIGIYNAYKATEHFREGDIQKGKRYRANAIVAMVMTVIIGIIFTVGVYFVQNKQHQGY